MKSEELIIRMSICPDCKGNVRIAVVHLMTENSIKEFDAEVKYYGLSVKEEPLSEYNKTPTNWCRCQY